jgi:hypothetical protein
MILPILPAVITFLTCILSTGSSLYELDHKIRRLDGMKESGIYAWL